ncbi:kinase-like domain-containing protein [Aspergillus ambiguus]|uniref:protein kinase family protein n=1 Tax=Aspergillus ambiguus TaxID=176160 RepID=UPI003CCD7B6B
MESWDSQVDEIFKELGRATLRSSEPTVPKEFITRARIKRIWQTNDRIRSLLGEDSPPGLHVIIKKKLLVILSVLIEIGAIDTLKEFRRKLFAADNPLRPRFTDQEMPLEPEQISQLLTYQPHMALFREKQNKFCPVIIPKSHLSIMCSEDRPLPFQRMIRLLGRGSYGAVYAVQIASECFTDELGASYSKPYLVACKQFREFRHFEAEVKNLRDIAYSRTQQVHILQALAAISHGNSHYILTPYAELGDLFAFLHEGRIDGEDDEDNAVDEVSYDFPIYFPDVSLSPENPSVFKPLLHQCHNLAHAVRWLHEEVTNQAGNKIYFTHMDLKPDNILIRNDPDSSVGRWIISDFGISSVQEVTHLAPPPVNGEATMYTFPKNNAKTYQAPEFRSRHGVGRHSDVWSFACIFSMVLAWAIGRRDGFITFKNERIESSQLKAFYEVLSGHVTGPGYQVNTSVNEWLNSVENTPQPHRIAGCWAAAIRRLLVVDPRRRPNSSDLVTYVDHVYNHCDNLSDARYRNCRRLSPGVNEWVAPIPANVEMPRILGSSTRVRPIIRLLEHVLPSMMPSEELTAMKRRIGRRDVLVAVSRSIHLSTVPLVYFGGGLLLVFGLDPETCVPTARDLWRIVEPTYSDWENPGISIEGPYLAVWGYCRRAQRKLCVLGSLDSPSELDIIDSEAIQPLKSVAMSSRGMAAFVLNNDIIVRPKWNDSTEELPLRCSGNDPQKFMHAVFDKPGNRLYAWAQGASTDSLYLWNCTAGGGLQNLSVTHYDRRGPEVPIVPYSRLRAGCAIMPYESRPGCIFVATDRREYFSLVLEGGPGGTFEERMRIIFDNALESVTCGDYVLIRLEKKYIHCHLKEYLIPHEAGATIGVTRELCRLQSDYRPSSVLGAFTTRTGQTVVLCNTDGTVEIVEFSYGDRRRSS